jgi:23S rRNA pseudouridine2605 synthase
MRINKFIALATGLSRRQTDRLIKTPGAVLVNSKPATIGQNIDESDEVVVQGKVLSHNFITTTLMLNKPIGYVVSRDGQGAPTIYSLLPKRYHGLKPVGRLDKDSSGLLLLTNNGQLAQELTHPGFKKAKVYKTQINKPMSDKDKKQIEKGVALEDGISQLRLSGQGVNWTIIMSEGRNRQIRRTFTALGYKVTTLHRIQFGPYNLGDLKPGKTDEILTNKE